MTTETSKALFPSSVSLANPQAKARILSKINEFDVYMEDVPPWGLIVPRDGANGITFFYMEFETLGLPQGTMLGIRWAPASGNHTHTLSVRINGNETHNTQIRIEEVWLDETEGQRVDIQHEVIWPDGRITVGDPLSVQVTKRITFSGMSVEGLNDGDSIDPISFPDGVRVNIDPIDNIAGHHLVYLSWEVWGQRPPGHHLALYRKYYSSPGKPGEGYSFLVPPTEYSGFTFPPETWPLRARIHAIVKLVPNPNQHFYMTQTRQTFPFLNSDQKSGKAVG